MKLVFAKIPDHLFKGPDGWPVHPDEADSWDLADLFASWCRYNGVWIGDKREERAVEYNAVYHFYDVHLYAILGNREDAQTSHFDAVKKLLEREGIQVTHWDTSWRWHKPNGETRNIQVPGVRFWIKAVEQVRIEDEKLLERALGAIQELSDEPRNTNFFWSAQNVAEALRKRLGKENECPKNAVPGAPTPSAPPPERPERAARPSASRRKSTGATARRSSRAERCSPASASPSTPTAPSRGATRSTSTTRRRTKKSA